MLKTSLETLNFRCCVRCYSAPAPLIVHLFFFIRVQCILFLWFQNLEAEHSLARSSPGSQPEQYANRRIVAKPLEGTCESCDFVASDMGSSRQSVSSRGSKKYSYAKSFSEASMTATYATDDRVPSPQVTR